MLSYQEEMPRVRTSLHFSLHLGGVVKIIELSHKLMEHQTVLCSYPNVIIHPRNQFLSFLSVQSGNCLAVPKIPQVRIMQNQ